ncbi:MAG TPA: tetratricopeptide repeat protein [Candidatus Obscuribacterales bacterium]
METTSRWLPTSPWAAIESSYSITARDSLLRSGLLPPYFMMTWFSSFLIHKPSSVLLFFFVLLSLSIPPATAQGDDPEELNQRGMDAFQSHQFPAAERYYVGALRLCEGHPGREQLAASILRNLSDCLRAQDRSAEAELCTLRAIRLGQGQERFGIAPKEVLDNVGKPDEYPQLYENPATPLVGPTSSASSTPKGPATTSSSVRLEAGKIRLSGSVVHSESLDAFPPSLRPGSHLQLDKLQNAPGNDYWYWVPNWLAGKFKYTEITRVVDKDLKTGKSLPGLPTTRQRVEVDAWGHLMDRSGGIWHHGRTPSYSIQKMPGNVWGVAVSEQLVPVYCDDSKYVTRLTWKKLAVDATTGKILAVHQAESIWTHVLVSPGVIRSTTSNESFDMEGKPVSLTTDIRIFRRIADFAPPPASELPKLQDSFRTYLQNNGLGALIPASSLPDSAQGSARK